MVGSTHRGSLGRVLVGDADLRTLHSARCPVAVAPRAFAGRAGTVETIGVGFDGGEIPVEELAALSERVDLLVVGSRGRARCAASFWEAQRRVWSSGLRAHC